MRLHNSFFYNAIEKYNSFGYINAVKRLKKALRCTKYPFNRKTVYMHELCALSMRLQSMTPMFQKEKC